MEPLLSKTERLLLSNQYRILAELIPDEKEYFDEARKIVESGYELHYRELTQNIYEPMSAEASREVLDILNMFEAIQDGMKNVTDRTGIWEHGLEFRGFDGNNETEQLGYASFYCDYDGGRFKHLNIKDLNSHMPTLDGYRRMLAAWKESAHERQLSKDDIARITNAAIHPENR